MAVFHSGDADIHYFSSGDGRPVMLIHGFASSHKINWGNTGWIDQLTRAGRRVIAPDLRGHGKSTKFYAPMQYHSRLMVGDMIGLMDLLSIESADIIGYSMGAWVSTHFMAAFPDRTGAVVLGGVGARMVDFGLKAEAMAQALRTPYPAQITEPFLRGLRDFAELAGNDLRALSACSRGVYSDGPPAFEQAAGPVLVIAGEKDDVAGPPDALAARMPNALSITVPACDHLTALTRREFKLEAIQFLDRHPHPKNVVSR